VPLSKIKAGTIYPVIQDSGNHEFFNRIGPYQPFIALIDAAVQLSHSCRSRILQHFDLGNDRVADEAPNCPLILKGRFRDLQFGQPYCIAPRSYCFILAMLLGASLS